MKRPICPMPWWLVYALLIVNLAGFVEPAQAQAPLRERLKALPFKIAYESYVNNNWEIFVMDPDGTHDVNLTHTPSVNEHYPQISPDGTKMCFAVDEGEGRDAVRSLWVMDVNGKHRRKLADHAREAFWSPDGKVIGFLPQEYPKFDVIDYYTKGMSFYDLATGTITPHVNSANLRHLYNPCWSANGKWIVATVHAGMGYSHTILLIEARGTNIINLKIPGCRPDLSPDGQQIAWGAGDHEIAVAPINLDSDRPAMGQWRLRLWDHKDKIYHVHWSPDSRFLAFSRGPDGEGDPTKPGTFQAACEVVGVYAPGWNLYVVAADRDGDLDLNKSGEADWVMLTTNGFSNKQPAWFRAKR
ncbi:MAG: hypothetical protein ABSE16_10225 [Verrucomicrobiota bacterium]